MSFYSEKTREMILNQRPIDAAIVNRVKQNLTKKGVVLEQSNDWDNYLISQGCEGITFSDGTMIMHTRVSASGFYEELIHYGQIKSGRVLYGDQRSMLLMEIEAKERLIINRNAYKITDYEIELLTSVLKSYKIDLENL